MKIFVATSYSSQVDYSTGLVLPEYKTWLEETLKQLEHYGHEVFCSLRADEYRINDADPAKAFSLDETQLKTADGFLALVTIAASAGVQTELGMAIALGKRIVIAHKKEDSLAYFNKAIVTAKQAVEVFLPLTEDPFKS